MTPWCKDSFRVCFRLLITVATLVSVTPVLTASESICEPIGQQNIIVLLIQNPGAPAPALTSADYYAGFFGPELSLSEYWRAASYGATWARGEVRGWYTLDATYECSNLDGIRAAAIRAASDVDFTRYSRIFIVLAGFTNCSRGGRATMSCDPLITPAGITFSASTAWILDRTYIRDELYLAAHEGGHNFGLMHAQGRRFKNTMLGAPGHLGTVEEYADPLSAMGASNLGAYAAPQKARLGWADVVNVTSSGSFTLASAETSPHFIRVRRGSTDTQWLWLEYRPNAGILIHYEDETTEPRATQLLDFTPDTPSWFDAPMPVGKSWTDSYTNTTIAVSSSSAGMVTVTVTYGSEKRFGPAKLPLRPLSSPSPWTRPGASTPTGMATSLHTVDRK